MNVIRKSEQLLYCDVESKRKKCHIITFNGQALSKNKRQMQDALKTKQCGRKKLLHKFGPPGGGGGGVLQQARLQTEADGTTQMKSCVPAS